MRFSMKNVLFASLVVSSVESFSVLPSASRHHLAPRAASRLHETTASSVESVGQDLEKAFTACQSEVAKTCKVTVAPVTGDGDGQRLGLVATQNIKKGEVVLAMPYDDRFILTPKLAKEVVFRDLLPESFDSWTGDAGLIALLILNEVARASSPEQAGIAQPERPAALQNLMAVWVQALPGPSEMNHPLLWSEDDQEVLQSSSTNKIYRQLDDLEEDATWLSANLFADRTKFPETVTLDNGTQIPCFSNAGFKWAYALAQSRCVFVDGSLRLIPMLDFCNHQDNGNEIQTGYMGTFGTVPGAQLVSNQQYKAGEQVYCSYGPKSAADYLLEHGFCPESCWATAVSELTFEIDPEDRFRDDKMDILEFETYDQAPMDPSQSFDVISAPGRDGEPDRAMIQFVRLAQLGSSDAFMLESIFRKDVWEFMESPVSEVNEKSVGKAVAEACAIALKDLELCPEGGPEICTKLRESETRALTRTMEYLQRDQEALDLKEYYQERRLKDLGLDSDWTPEDDVSTDLGFGQTRAPGGADYDW